MSRIEAIHAREVYDSRGRPTVEVEVRCAGARAGRAIVPSGASTGRFEAVELRDGVSADSGDKSPTPNDSGGKSPTTNVGGVRRAVENVRGEIAQALLGRDGADQAAIDAVLCELDGTGNKSRLGANAVLGVSLAASRAAAEACGVPLVEHLHRLWCSVKASRPPGTGQQKRGQAPFRTETNTASGLRTAKWGLTPFLQADSEIRPALPLPMVNMISGGLHAGGNLDFQDFLVLPVGAGSFRQAFEWALAVYRRLGEILIESGYEGRLVGDEGGYGPTLGARGHEQALEFLVRAIEAAHLTPGDDVAIGLDVAASHFFIPDAAGERTFVVADLSARPGDNSPTTNAGSGGRGDNTDDGRYRLRAEDGRSLSAEELIGFLQLLADRYPVISIEDGLAEDDWPGWRRLTGRLGARVQLIGDDLFATNPARLRRGIEEDVANSVLIKLNQIGTLTEAMQTMRLAFEAGYLPVVSARSGESEDPFIADFAVATAAGQIKIGSVVRSERLAKYNQLLRLEEELSGEARYAGGDVLKRFRN